MQNNAPNYNNQSPNGGGNYNSDSQQKYETNFSFAGYVNYVGGNDQGTMAYLILGKKNSGNAKLPLISFRFVAFQKSNPDLVQTIRSLQKGQYVHVKKSWPSNSELLINNQPVFINNNRKVEQIDWIVSELEIAPPRQDSGGQGGQGGFGQPQNNGGGFQQPQNPPQGHPHNNGGGFQQPQNPPQGQPHNNGGGFQQPQNPPQGQPHNNGSGFQQPQNPPQGQPHNNGGGFQQPQNNNNGGFNQPTGNNNGGGNQQGGGFDNSFDDDIPF